MHVNDLRKIFEAVPYDFRVKVKPATNTHIVDVEVETIYIDFKNKKIVMGDKK